MVQLRNWCFWAAVTIITMSPVLAAGFDCDRAGTEVEKSICRDKTLSRLDDELNALYYIATKIPTTTARSKRSQHQWLRQRNGCTDNLCLNNAYTKRLEELRIDISRVAEPMPEQSKWIRDYGKSETGYSKLSGATNSFNITIENAYPNINGALLCIYDGGRRVEDGTILSGSTSSNIANVEYEAGFNQITKSSAIVVVANSKLYWAVLRDIDGSYCPAREVLSKAKEQKGGGGIIK
jgi:uncharacterized protein